MSVVALVATVVVGFGSVAGAGPSVDTGVGLANFGAEHYSYTDGGYIGIVTIGGVYLQGRLTLGGQTYQGQMFLDRMSGRAPLCVSPYNCSPFEENTYAMQIAPAGFWGKHGTDRVDGSCHGGTFSTGGVYGKRLTTQCTVAVNQGVPHAFDIDIQQLLGTKKVNGYYCVDAPVGCGFTVSIDNPGLFGP